MHDLVNILRQQQEEFGPLVRFNSNIDRLVAMDFTSSNKSLTPELLNDTVKFTAYVNEELRHRQALYGIGGYAEHRNIYSRSELFDGATGEEPRRLHLGLDVWGRPYSAVMAPVEGLVHSFAYNDRRGDYGATLILTHRLGELSFFTLYGHLSLNSIKNRRAGELVKRGEVIGEFGIPAENGQWPPHLHFQVIRDIGAFQGDYPGVCKFSEREQWLANCPDPDLLARLNRYIIS